MKRAKQRAVKIVDSCWLHGKLTFKVRPALDITPGSRVQRIDGDEWVIREVIQVGPRTTCLQFNAGPYEPHIGDELAVTWRNPDEYDLAGRVRPRRTA